MEHENLRVGYSREMGFLDGDFTVQHMILYHATVCCAIYHDASYLVTLTYIQDPSGILQAIMSGSCFETLPIALCKTGNAQT